MEIVDARGKACPMPVIMAKKVMDAGQLELKIMVDNEIALQNLQRLAQSQGYSYQQQSGEGLMTLICSKNGSGGKVAKPPLATDSQGISLYQEAPQFLPQKEESWVLFVSRKAIGDGSQALGENLMTLLFYTLAQSAQLPQAILFMNSGVELVCLNDQVVEHLQGMRDQGTQILVCGTCLDYFGLIEQLKIGKISNMYDIFNCMQAAAKVISI